MRNLIRGTLHACSMALIGAACVALGGCSLSWAGLVEGVEQVGVGAQSFVSGAVSDLGNLATAANNANLAGANLACNYLEAGVAAWNQFVAANPTAMSDADDKEGNLYATAVDKGCANAPFTSLTQEAIGVYNGYVAFAALAAQYGIAIKPITL